MKGNSSSCGSLEWGRTAPPDGASGLLAARGGSLLPRGPDACMLERGLVACLLRHRVGPYCRRRRRRRCRPSTAFEALSSVPTTASCTSPSLRPSSECVRAGARRQQQQRRRRQRGSVECSGSWTLRRAAVQQRLLQLRHPSYSPPPPPRLPDAAATCACVCGPALRPPHAGGHPALFAPSNPAPPPPPHTPPSSSLMLHLSPPPPPPSQRRRLRGPLLHHPPPEQGRVTAGGVC